MACCTVLRLSKTDTEVEGRMHEHIDRLSPEVSRAKSLLVVAQRTAQGTLRAKRRDSVLMRSYCGYEEDERLPLIAQSDPFPDHIGT